MKKETNQQDSRAPQVSDDEYLKIKKAVLKRLQEDGTVATKYFDSSESGYEILIHSAIA